MDDACTSSKTSAVQNLSKLKYIQVGEFLTHLYGKCSDVNECGKSKNGLWFCNNQKIDAKCSIKMILDQYADTNTNHAQRLLNAYLNFNHFSKSYDCLILKDLDFIRIIKRCAAIHRKREESKIDLVIPITFNLNNFDELSAILVQVNLDKKSEMVSYNEAFENVRFRSLGVGDNLQPFLLLIMELGCPTNSENVILKYFHSETIKDKISSQDVYQNLSSAIPNIKTSSDLIDDEKEFRSNLFSMGISNNIFPALSSTAVTNLIKLSNAKPKSYFNGPNPLDNKRLNQINIINSQILPSMKCMFKK